MHDVSIFPKLSSRKIFFNTNLPNRPQNQPSYSKTKRIIGIRKIFKTYFLKFLSSINLIIMSTILKPESTRSKKLKNFSIIFKKKNRNCLMVGEKIFWMLIFQERVVKMSKLFIVCTYDWTLVREINYFILKEIKQGLN